MIDVDTAGQLLDLGARIGQGPRAQEQLDGAVAIHNILEKRRVAYLADEVGMGKTYVALGALALFRHFKPDFRVLVIAPKENIQRKWMKEFGNFVAHNLKFPDLRMAAIDRQPARPLIACDNLMEFVREAVVDPRRDFFLRLSSFSLALGDDVERRGWRRVRDELRQEVPWLPEAALDLRSNKDVFKDNFARAVCCALPVFDLVIVDEGHNLKHGFKTGVAARNRVLALAFGHPSEGEGNRLFSGYGPRARRVLFLSATPLEETYRHVWNQLDVFGLGKNFEGLRDDSLTEDEKKQVAGKFLVRRVTTMRVGGEDLTKNQYRREWRRGVRATEAQTPDTLQGDLDTDDRGGTDTFFAWFFRGEGPKGVVSGANVQRRFIQKGTIYSTFFEQNYVMDLLDARPGGVADALAARLGLESGQLRNQLRQRAAKYIGQAKRLQRADRMEAAQAAALELLKEQQTELGERARIIWHERFESSKRTVAGGEAPDVSEGLEHATFFTELRREERSDLRNALWPEPRSGSIQYQFRQRQQRAQMLETAARLGHSLIDLYILTIHRLGSLEQRTLEVDSGKENAALERRRIDEYLDVLEKQRTTLLSERNWAAFDELKQISDNFDLILDVNAPEVRTQTFAESRRALGSILGEQQPVGGMSGQVNQRLVQQFRMPGYPFVLVTTDLLQEGEDLHTFCSAVHHYGIAWTPSSMEQRIGRIDRVRSQSDRRLSGLDAIPDGAVLVQVYPTRTSKTPWRFFKYSLSWNG